MAELLHLTKRFFGAVRPGAPSVADERWATDKLLDGERDVWAAMNNPDRRHAVAVAKAVVAEFEAAKSDAGEDRAVLAAALLHDSGKVLSGLRTPGRVLATVFWMIADDALADRWLEPAVSGIRRRLAQYRRHPELGAEMLRAAGSDPLTAAWAGDHHRPESTWVVPVEIGAVLKACDDD